MDSKALLSSAVDIAGRSETFWGRSEMWKMLITMNTSPLIGVGYESFWLGSRLDTLWTEYWWHPNQAHNGYLETYLNLGWIGLILLGGVILNSYRNILKSFNSNFDYGRFRMAFLIIALLYNVTSAAFKGLHIIWFVFLVISMNYSHEIVSEGPEKPSVSLGS
jgi:O-antigen ligase